MKSRNASITYRYRFADVEYDEAQNALRLDGQPVSVEPLPLQLLAILLRRPDEVVSRAELFELLWQGRPTVDHVLTNAVSKLRRALGEQASSKLMNLPRVGYRLTGPIERIVVGRKPLETVDLAPGKVVPGRVDLVLQERLGEDPSSMVWLVKHRRLPERQVFKFASDGDQLSAIKRELTVSRLMLRELGRRPDLVTVRESNFSVPPFFVAYDYAGIDLRTWAAEQPHLSAMALEERLKLFLMIAHAAAAAHSVGVLHRDLKPANVLIDERVLKATGYQETTPVGSGFRWQIKLTDFGSGHLLLPGRLAELGITSMGMTIAGAGHPLVGATPHYLAPELLAGDAPTMRSDVYALGLMLYQLIVGDLSRPLATGWEHDIADPLLAEDVRAATEGRPERRLASVAQLIDRLESLEQRRAQREETAEISRQMELASNRIKEMRSRRPWLLALALVIAAGSLGSAWFGVQARSAQRDAERASVRSRAVSDFLNLDVLRSADVTQLGAGRINVSLIEVVARASDRVGERFKDDMPVLGQIRRQLGDIYLGMYFSDQAEDEYRRAITVFESSVPAGDPELLVARFGLAEALTGRGDVGEPLAKLELAERAAGPSLLASSGVVAQRALRARVQVLMDLQRFSEALPHAQRLVRLTDDRPHDDTLDLTRRLEARQWLCEIYMHLGDTASATALIERLAYPPFNNKNVGAVAFARVQLRLARDRLRQDRLSEAESLLTQLRDTPSSDLRPNELHVGLLNTRLHEIYRKSGRFREDVQASEAALSAYRATLGEKHSLVTISRIHAALSRLELGEVAGALRELESARLRLDANGRHVADLMDIELGRIRALNNLGRYSEAMDLAKDLDQLRLQHSAAQPPGLAAELRAELGRALWASGQVDLGRTAIAQAVSEMHETKAPPWKLLRYQSFSKAPGEHRGELP